MQLGSFEVPEIRLVPSCMIDLKKIYDVQKTKEIKSSDLSTLLGYKYATNTQFYRRLNSLVSYGLLDGRGTYRISELGQHLLFPEGEGDKTESMLRTKAVLNVPLWKALYEEYKKSPPLENFWVKLKNITGSEPERAKTLEQQIRNWYLEDIAHVSESELAKTSALDSKGEPKDLSSKDSNTKSMSQQLVVPQLDQEKLEFGKAVLLLPKNDLKKEWEKLQKYMTIFLEDYKPDSNEIKPESDQA